MSDRVLVVGGDGQIGRALGQELRRRGQPFLATSRRPEASCRLDLARPEEWAIPEGIKSAVLCAAATNLAFCREHPDEAHRVNVTHTLRLARALAERGCFVTFLSTNLVFDGQTPRVPPDAPLNPRTVYGCQKAEVERALLQQFQDCAIIRLSKVFAPDMPLLANWRRELREGRTVEAFSDYRCAPIDLATTVQAIADIASGRRVGIWQLSPEQDVSYADIAAELARKLNLPSDRVRAIPSTERTRLEHIPLHTTLDATRARDELNLEFPPMPVVLDRIWDS